MGRSVVKGENEPGDVEYRRLNCLLEYGIDLRDRTVFVLGDIESPSAEYIIQAIHVMQGKDPIRLVINSPGGSDHFMFHLYDAINTSICPVSTHVSGMACSAASLILAAGCYRTATENSFCMLHKGRISGFCGDDDEVQAVAEINQRSAEDYWAVLARHTKRTAKWWLSRVREAGQLWLDAPEMLKLGVIDEIVAPTRKLSKIRRTGLSDRRSVKI